LTTKFSTDVRLIIQMQRAKELAKSQDRRDLMDFANKVSNQLLSARYLTESVAAAPQYVSARAFGRRADNNP